MGNVKLRIGAISNPTTKNRDYVYNDINSNLLANSNKTDMRNNSDADAVLGSIKNLFMYKPGQRILTPEYGMDFSNLIYQPMNDKTAEAIGITIQNALKKWEPRVIISRIDIDPDYEDNTYYVKVSFRIRNLVTKEYQFTEAIRRSL